MSTNVRKPSIVTLLITGITVSAVSVTAQAAFATLSRQFSFGDAARSPVSIVARPQSAEPKPNTIAQLPAATRSARVQFAPGRSSASVAGKVRGYDTIDYVLNARAGQQMRVQVSSNNPSLATIIIGPDGNAICPEPCTFPWNDTLPDDGNYRVRVGLERAEARRGTQANYTLNFRITN